MTMKQEKEDKSKDTNTSSLSKQIQNNNKNKNILEIQNALIMKEKGKADKGAKKCEEEKCEKKEENHAAYKATVRRLNVSGLKAEEGSQQKVFKNENKKGKAKQNSDAKAPFEVRGNNNSNETFLEIEDKIKSREDEDENVSIPCPIDARHLIKKSHVLRHIKKCTQVRDWCYEAIQPFVLEGCNNTCFATCACSREIEKSCKEFNKNYLIQETTNKYGSLAQETCKSSNSETSKHNPYAWNHIVTSGNEEIYKSPHRGSACNDAANIGKNFNTSANNSTYNRTYESSNCFFEGTNAQHEQSIDTHHNVCRTKKERFNWEKDEEESFFKKIDDAFDYCCAYLKVDKNFFLQDLCSSEKLNVRKSMNEKNALGKVIAAQSEKTKQPNLKSNYSTENIMCSEKEGEEEDNKSNRGLESSAIFFNSICKDSQEKKNVKPEEDVNEEREGLEKTESNKHNLSLINESNVHECEHLGADILFLDCNKDKYDKNNDVGSERRNKMQLLSYDSLATSTKNISEKKLNELKNAYVLNKTILNACSAAIKDRQKSKENLLLDAKKRNKSVSSVDEASLKIDVAFPCLDDSLSSSVSSSNSRTSLNLSSTVSSSPPSTFVSFKEYIFANDQERIKYNFKDFNCLLQHMNKHDIQNAALVNVCISHSFFQGQLSAQNREKEQSIEDFSINESWVFIEFGAGKAALTRWLIYTAKAIAKWHRSVCGKPLTTMCEILQRLKLKRRNVIQHQIQEKAKFSFQTTTVHNTNNSSLSSVENNPEIIPEFQNKKYLVKEEKKSEARFLILEKESRRFGKHNKNKNMLTNKDVDKSIIRFRVNIRNFDLGSFLAYTNLSKKPKSLYCDFSAREVPSFINKLKTMGSRISSNFDDTDEVWKFISKNAKGGGPNLNHIEECLVEKFKNNRVKRLVCVSKHLCGNGSDISIRCIVNGLSKLQNLYKKNKEEEQENSSTDFYCLPDTFISISSCCLHRCDITTFVGIDFLTNELGFSRLDFDCLKFISAWSTSSLESYYKQLVGYKVRVILNTSRVSWLRSHGFEDACLLSFIPSSITPENLLIVASRRFNRNEVQRL